MYYKKLGKFFKSKGLKQKEVGRILGVSPAMMGRYLNGTAGIGSEFIINTLKNFPELDLNDIFSDNTQDRINEVNELRAIYEKTTIVKDIEEIQVKLDIIKEKLYRKEQKEETQSEEV